MYSFNELCTISCVSRKTEAKKNSIVYNMEHYGVHMELRC
jgi:hypothetical protein